jgi:hypothetical protein
MNQKEGSMKLTKGEIALLKESLELGIQDVRNESAPYEQRESKINDMQALSRKLTKMDKETD